MGIVKIQRMGQRAVDQRRRHGRVTAPVAEHRTIARNLAQAFDRADEAGRAFRVVAGAHHDAGDIQDQKLGAGRDFGRQLVIGQAGGEFSQLAGSARHRSVSSMR